MFADDDEKNALSGVVNYADDDLNWLYPRYVSNVKSFICPSTKNNVGTNRGAIYAGLVSPAFPSGPNDSGVPFYQDRIHGDDSYLIDLIDNADGKKGTMRHSYEISGFLNGTTAPGVRKTQAVIAAYSYRNNNTSFPQFNYYRQTASPSDIWIIYDADDRDPYGDPERKNGDYPDAGDNHGRDGANIIFCDGHAEWVPQKNYLKSFFRGTDETHSAIIP